MDSSSQSLLDAIARAIEELTKYEAAAEAKEDEKAEERGEEAEEEEDDDEGVRGQQAHGAERG